MRTLLILAGLSLAAIAGGVELRTTLKASEARAATAAEWSGDAAQSLIGGAIFTKRIFSNPFTTAHWQVCCVPSSPVYDAPL